MIDWDAVAPMVVAVVFFLTIGGVAVLRPLSKRLGDLLDVMIRERQGSGGGSSERELGRIRELLESMDGRLSLLEERQDFTDSLLRDARRDVLTAGSTVAEKR